MTDDFIGKVIAEKYRVDTLLRESDQGTFYRGWHMIMDRAVTVRILPRVLATDARYVKKFLTDTKLLASVSSANVLTVNDFGTDHRDITYAVFEAAPEKTLRQDIVKEEAMPLPTVLPIAKGIADGLAAAHSKGLIHGGLTPAKVLVADDENNHE